MRTACLILAVVAAAVAGGVYTYGVLEGFTWREVTVLILAGTAALGGLAVDIGTGER